MAARLESLPDRLAFVDVETTGVDAASDRIVDIGVVTFDSSGVTSWGALVNPGHRTSRTLPGASPDELADAPRFFEIASSLAQRLAGRVVVAHNARFDHAFLAAEFARCGIAFSADSICTVMLVRRLLRGPFNLDALAHRFGIKISTRHRALPDAQALFAFWEKLRASYPEETLCRALSMVASGQNRRSVARVASTLDARLKRACATEKRAWSLHIDASDPVTPLRIVAAEDPREDLYGLFDSERKARNALERIVQGHALEAPGHAARIARLTQALWPLRIRPWPYAGPVAVRERAALHVFDRWRYLGTALNEADLHNLSGAKRVLNVKVYQMLNRLLERSPWRFVPVRMESGESQRAWR